MRALLEMVLLGFLGQADGVGRGASCAIAEDAGEPCDALSRAYPKADCDSSQHFFVCGRDALLQQSRCPTDGIFDVISRRCRNPTPYPYSEGLGRYKRQTNSATGLIGQSCTFNIDCGGSGGLYCAGGLCACTSGFVQSLVNTDRCLEKINPNQPGCTENIQCSAVWYSLPLPSRIVWRLRSRLRMRLGGAGSGRCARPASVNAPTRRRTTPSRRGMALSASELAPASSPAHSPPSSRPAPQFRGYHRFGARCNLGRCECSDATNEYVVETRDGTVCVRDQNNGATQSCPLPSGLESPSNLPQGQTSLLYDTAGTVVSCTNNPTTNAFAACQVAGQPGIADMYDCIPRRQFAGMHCCPNRAFTCMQPLNTGGNPTATTTFQRWWYNSITDQCTQFTYTGRNNAGPFPSGNSNNFGSRDHCESYCRDRCERGQPAYTTGSYVPATTAVSCSSVSACANSNFECQTIGTQSRCCNTPTFICGINGGLTVVPQTPATGYDGDGNTGTGVTTLTRWYYDEANRRCLRFTWSQYGGSYNNFATQTECETFCLNLCTYGEPLKVDSNINSPNKACPCPQDYTCTNSVCCPTTQLICTQSKNVGRACTGIGGSSYVTRYFYNSVTQRCESFTYGGCDGNLNNFEDESTCITACASIIQRPTCPQGRPLSYSTTSTTGLVYTTCSSLSGTQGGCPGNYECINGGCCATRSYTCSLGYDVGSACGAQSTRFYYDTTTGRCGSFTYLGCDGNSNNFGSQETCESYCGAGGCPNGGSPARDVTTNAFLDCSLTSTACPTNYECSNVLINSISTQSVCCPSRTYVCSLGAYAGDSNCGTGGTTRYYFDTSSRSCRAFIFNGCSANENNFLTVDECNNYCGSAACTAGQVVLGGGGTTASTCTVGVATSCPTAYTCTLDTLFNRNVCCGADDVEGVCSYGETAYIDPSSRRATRCQPGTIASCPTDYFCRLNTRVTNGEYVCCKPTIFCTSGYLPALSVSNLFSSGSTSTSKPIACYIGGTAGFGNFGTGVSTTCPTSYSCQNTVPGSPTGYCCSLQRVCPSGFELYRTSGGLYQTCTPNNNGFNSCPANYRCVASNGFTGYCCGQGSSAQYCGATGRVLSDASGTPRQCQPSSGGGFNASPCPSGYSCTASGSGLYYCCAGVSGVCGTGQVQTVGANQIQLCNRVGDTVCASGYSCTLNADSGQYYCCSGGSSACPAPGIPQRVNGGSVACNPTQSGGCGAGFQCASTSGSTSGLCCSGVGATVCGEGFQVYQPGGTPVTCQLTDNRCGNNRVCKLYAPSNTYYCCEPDQSTNVCPSGSPRLLGNGNPQTCAGTNSCPVGFACIFSATFNSNYCCSTGDSSASCPQGGVLEARTCSPQVANSCSGTGTCQLISGNGVNRYQCCRNSNAGSVCSNGQTPTSTICSPSASTCPFGTVCLLVTSSGRYQCCPNAGTAGQPCPLGGVATASACIAGSNTCGAGNSCQVVGGTNVCCTGGSSDGMSCPRGGALQIDISCRTETGNSCGAGNNCQRISSLGTNQFRCCFGVNVASGGACPNGGSLTSTVCSPGFNNCPSGSSCQTVAGIGNRCCTSVGNGGSSNVGTACPTGGFVVSPQSFCSPSPSDTCAPRGLNCQLVGGRYQCCGQRSAVGPTTPGTCPQGGTPSVPARPCSPSVQSSCPNPGESCQDLGTRFQCCRDGGGGGGGGTQVQSTCTNGQAAYVSSTTGQNLVCVASNPNGCPPSFVCVGGICCGSGGGGGGGSTGACPSNRRYKYPATNSDLGCVLGGTRCPPGYTCQQVPDVQSEGVCCSSNRARAETSNSNFTNFDRFGVGSSEFSSKKLANLNGRVPKTCTVLPCLPGQRGCTSSVECLQGHCEAGRCLCPSNQLIGPYGKCVSSCGAGYRNMAGECVSIDIVKLSDDAEDSSSEASEKDSQEISLLRKNCSAKKPCQGDGLVCNDRSGVCECAPTLKPRDPSSCAAP